MEDELVLSTFALSCLRTDELEDDLLSFAEVLFVSRKNLTRLLKYEKKKYNKKS